MKIIDKKIYVTFDEMVETGAVTDGYLKKAKSTGTKCWTFIKDPEDNRKVLIEFETLKDQYKKAVELRFGNPFDYCARQPIKKMVVKDHKAEEFFITYSFDNKKKLPIEHVRKYTEAASWLNMLISACEDKKAIKKLAGSLDTFWLNVCDLIKTENIDLPTSFKHLKRTIVDYKENGYACLIDHRFGNKLAAKVKDEFTESLLLQLLSHHNQHDDTIIAGIYNNTATANGYEAITASTVGRWKRENYYQIQGAREGNSAWYNTYGKSIHRKRPSAPLLLINSDDNDLDLYFKEERTNKKGGTETNHYFRYKLIVVIDAYNDYILGYSYGKEVSIDLIKAAYLDAIYHVKMLTGGWYLPHQLQTDRWSLDNKLEGKLATFYKGIGTVTPATLKVARAKYIEQSFGTRWHQSLKMFNNYAGHNITSQSRINADALAINKSSFPYKEDAPAYIEAHINRMRSLVDEKTKLTRQQQWLQMFQSSELSQEKRISDARMLHIYGQPHTHINTITKEGIQVSINGASMVYEVPDELYLENVGKKVQVYYDLYNTSRVLVTDNDKLRFIAHEVNPMASAIADYSEGDRTRLNQMLQAKRNHVAQIISNQQKRETVLLNSGIDAQGLLQAGVLIKGVKQAAEISYQQTQLGQISNYNPLDQM